MQAGDHAETKVAITWSGHKYMQQHMHIHNYISFLQQFTLHG